MTNKMIVDCATGTIGIVPLSTEELFVREQLAIIEAEHKAQEEADLLAKTQAKESAIAKLTALGLSESEIQTIIGA